MDRDEQREGYEKTRGQGIYWEPANPVHFINHAYDYRATNALEELFGAFPILINREHLPTLRAIARVGGGRPLDEIIHAVEETGEIRVWWDDSDWRTVEIRERGTLRPRASAEPAAVAVED